MVDTETLTQITGKKESLQSLCIRSPGSLDQDNFGKRTDTQECIAA
jgi:hypothetical protein